jgi:hypothetical protein
MATLIDLVQRTITRLSMVPGAGTQIYAEDRIAEMIWHKFIVLRSDLFWDDFMDYVQLTCGPVGFPQESVVRVPAIPPSPLDIVINRFSDIQHVWNENDPEPLAQMPRRNNPLAYAKSGAKPRLYVPDVTHVVRFLPYGEGRLMTLRVKRYYPFFLATDEVPMDEQALILGTAYDYLEDDGSNPSQIEKFRAMFDARVLQLKREENQGPIPISYTGAA